MELSKAIVLLTNQCNLRCTYCFENHNAQYMSLDTAKDVLNYFHKNSNTPGFTLFGGEPMLMFDSIIYPLVEYSKTLKKSTRFAMTTNGTLLTKENLDWLIENNISFMFSMDGGRGTQDHNRPLKTGGSSYDKVIDIIPYVLEKIPNQTFRATLIPDTIGNFFDDMMFLDSLGVTSFFALPDLFQPWNDKAKQEYAHQMKLYENYVIECVKSGKKPFMLRDVFRDGFGNLKNINKSKGRRTYIRCSPDRQCGMCQHGSASCDINGDFYGCHHISPMTRDSIWYLGNCYDGIDDERVDRLASLYKQFECGNEQCKDCPLDEVCFGGCKPNNFMIMGDVNKVPDMFCFCNRLITDTAYNILLELHDIDFFKEVIWDVK